MAKERRRRARKLGLSISVRHPESETEYLAENPEMRERAISQYADESDGDGHIFYGYMSTMPGEFLADVQLRRGMSAGCAVSILRKIADRIERNGDALLNLTGSTSGAFDKDGTFVNDGLGDDDDDCEERFPLPGEQPE